MPSLAIVGVQWGDEGKGKVTDALTDAADVVCRYGGGANAGHTVYVGDDKFVLHLIPSGILHERVNCLIGNGVVVNPDTLIGEIDALVARGVRVDPERFLVSDRAHVVMPYHPALDRLRERRRGKGKIGTTGRGIGPCYTDKTARVGVRMIDLLSEKRFRARLERALPEKRALLAESDPESVDLDRMMEAYERWEPLRAYVGDTICPLHEALDRGDRVLFEGAQGALLDVDFGTFPYVTSSNAGIGGLSAGTGVPPARIDRVIGVAKGYCTRVGEGPFPTELVGDLGEHLRAVGHEFGATTGRPRRCGWFDIPAARHAIRFCGIDSLCLTKLDVLSGLETVSVCVGYREVEAGAARSLPADSLDVDALEPIYEKLPGWEEPIDAMTREEDLPDAARSYVRFLEEQLSVPIQWLSVGKRRDQLINRRGAPPWPAR
ncbi:MAG: adenylosuccinate synthase [Planctomycetota bacterium]|jgi:adenylosuccinate synthase